MIHIVRIVKYICSSRHKEKLMTSRNLSNLIDYKNWFFKAAIILFNISIRFRIQDILSNTCMHVQYKQCIFTIKRFESGS